MVFIGWEATQKPRVIDDRLKELGGEIFRKQHSSLSASELAEGGGGAVFFGFDDLIEEAPDFEGRIDDELGGGVAGLADGNGDAPHAGEDGFVGDVVADVDEKRIGVIFEGEQKADGGPFVDARTGKNFPDFFAREEMEAAVFGEDLVDESARSANAGLASVAVVDGKAGFFRLEANAFDAAELRSDRAASTGENFFFGAVHEGDGVAARILHGVAVAADVADVMEADFIADVDEAAAGDDADEIALAGELGESVADAKGHFDVFGSAANGREGAVEIREDGDTGSGGDFLGHLAREAIELAGLVTACGFRRRVFVDRHDLFAAARMARAS